MVVLADLYREVSDPPRRCTVRSALFCLFLLFCPSLNATEVEVHFRFFYEVQPPDVAVGLLGSMTSWGAPPDGYYVVFEDDDGDNVWQGSMVLEEGRYFYKFVSLSSTEPDVSSSYPDVTGWYPDPLNPLTDGSAYNNSVLNVADPMIYYLLPMDGSEVENQRPLLSANIAAGVEIGIDVASLSMTFDGTDVTALAIFDSLTGQLAYQPTSNLSLGTHTLQIAARNMTGDAVSDTSVFTIIQGPPRMDVRFLLDTLSPNFDLLMGVERVQIAGDFNGWNPATARLSDDDGDGIWDGTVRFPIGDRFEYRFTVMDTISNSTIWIPDPDNPSLELRDPGDWYVSLGRANPDGTPRVVDLAVLQGRIFPPGETGIVAEFMALPGDWGTPLIPDSLTATYDGSPLATFTQVSGDTIFATVELPPIDEGLHRLAITAVDDIGRRETAAFSFGAYREGSGFHVIDAIDDDKGPGRYRYPDDVEEQSADILAFHVGTSTRLDPTMIQIVIELEHVDPHTAVGLLIASTLEGMPTPFPGSLELLGPSWVRQGAFIWLVPPSSPFYDDSLHNRLILDWDPLRVGPPVAVNPDPEETGSFSVTVPLDELEMHLGSYSGAWHYTLFSVIHTGGEFELEPTHGGWTDREDPDVYDLAFFPDRASQERILGSWIGNGMPGGPRTVKLVIPGRGILSLPPDSIAGLPEPGPEVLFYSAGARRIRRDFTVTGFVADATVTSGIFHHGHSIWPVDIVDGSFSVPLQLFDGPNFMGLSVVDDEGNAATHWARYDCHPDKTPKARIQVEAGPDAVQLDGSGSFHPEGLPLISFMWTEEPGNPEAIDLSGSASIQASFPLPETYGEYAVRLAVGDGDLVGNAVVTILVDSTGAQHMAIENHPAWAGDNILYEIYPVSYSGDRDLDAITDDIDRIIGLGVRSIWLTPIFEGPEAHGYAITDYFRVNPSLGGGTALTRLIEAAHDAGIKLILDLVINHTSLQHPFMKDAVRYGENSIYRDYYLWNPDGSYQSYWADLPNLNYANPEVWRHFLAASMYWIEQYDIDGYRCDVAWGIQERNPEFWIAWRDSLKQVKDNLLLLAEASTDDGSLFQRRFDAAYDWGFRNHIRELLSGNEPPLSLHQHLVGFQGTGSGPLALRFIENHDETRFVGEFGDARTRLAAALLYTVPGLPLLYAGQEVGEMTSRYYIDWSDPLNLQPFYRSLGIIRNAFACLRNGSYFWVPNSNTSTIYSFSREKGEQRIVVAANCSDATQSIILGLPVERWGFEDGQQWIISDVLGGWHASFTTEELNSLSLDLSPYQIVIAVVADSLTVQSPPDISVEPTELALSPPSPNPARGPVRFAFSLPVGDAVAIDLYDLLGRRRARILEPTPYNAGQHEVIWNQGEVQPGIYLVVFRAARMQKTERLVLLSR